ncbi:hypothetical protein [Salinivibrio proteolyticus]|uniref:Uncharacterized protein n=1 Tax=Salinivibrio proteolyticus TaxID=334715 RepID=A0ABY7LAY2_9GAMM|nr:hypothetical protein [Salinivibrio proteolyticus]WBA13782.1 hypothetical protein N7E60_08480 [Salinivibrio proteolyticus]
MTNTTDVKFISKLEETISRSILSFFPSEWEEDTISLILLKKIREAFTNYHVFYGRYEPEGVFWSAYKYKGKIEYKHGDIGVLVKIVYRDGSHIEGVGFLEAKKRYPRKLTFDSFSIPQLRRINKLSPYTNVLLYDYEDITGFIANSAIPLGILEEKNVSQGLAIKAVTNALVVQAGTVLSDGAKDLTLYKFGIPLSHQIGLRYIQGLDLDFRKEVVDSVKGFNEKRGVCNYVLQITVSHIGDDIPEYDIKLNNNYYEEI